MGLFPSNKFTILREPKTPEETYKMDPEENKKPDMRIQINGTFLTFWVECKWRAEYEKKGRYKNINWCKDREQHERYIQFEKETNEPVYIAIGIGGLPDYPDHLYFIPLKEIELTGEPLYSKTYDDHYKTRDMIFRAETEEETVIVHKLKHIL